MEPFLGDNNVLLLLHSRLQTLTGRAKSQKPEGPSREDSPVRKEKTSERKENYNKTNNIMVIDLVTLTFAFQL